MYTNDVKENILRFISTVGAVNEAQIEYMFRDAPPKEIKIALMGLVSERIVLKNDQGIYTKKKNYTVSRFIQKQISKAAWVLAYFGAQQIAEFYVTQYPSQLYFITMDGVGYDVTMIYSENAYDTIQNVRRIFQVSSEKDDCTKHIAMAFGMTDVTQEIKDSGLFDYYAVIEDNKVRLIPLKRS